MNSESPQPSRTSMSEAARQSFESGREQGTREALETAANNRLVLLQEADRKRIEQAANLGGQIQMDREQFLHEVEPELVQLALGIAARILRREAQMDPLFLMGAVRVALGQLVATMQVRLRVPAEESGLWNETLAQIPNLKVKAVVIPDDTMQLGDCLIETEMGSVDLGLRAQIRQMEHALLDGDVAPMTDDSQDFRLPERQVQV
ncbi:MAG: FliH/SctL family protein [Terracidiphilus sp.]